MKPIGDHRRSVGHTLLAGIAIILIVGMGALMYVVYDLQRTFFLEKVEKETEKTSEIVKQSLESAMVAHQPDKIQETLSKIARIDGIRMVMFIDREGNVKWSGDPGQIGKRMNNSDPSCQPCHRLPPGMRPRAVELNVKGAHIFRSMNPLYNKEVCQQCHGVNARINGALLLDVSMEDTDRIIASVAKNTFAVSLAILAVISGAIFWMTRRFIQKPIGRLVEGSRRIGSGDLGASIDIRGNNEFGELAQAFNQMGDNLADYVRQVEGKTRLESYSRALEEKVAERTGELERANREMKRVNEELIESYGKLESGHMQLMETQAQLFESGKLAALGELAGGVAHELNNPLAGVMTFVEALHDKSRSNGAEEAFAEDSRRILPHIKRELRRCRRIIEDLLAFARVKGDGATHVNLNDVIREVVAVLEAQPDFREVEIATDLAEGLREIRADRNHAAQVVMNAMVNAAQAIDGPGKVTVKTRGPEEGGEVVLTVTDTGRGISEEARRKIFEPFFTTKEKGSGLGLSITKGIVERLGGRIEIDSREGLGTSFAFAFPAPPPEGAPEGPAPETAEP